MRQRSTSQKVLIVIAGFMAVWLGAYFLYQKPHAEKTLPGLRARLGGGGASAEFLNAKKAAEYYQYEIRRNPKVAENYVQLAHIFLQEARVTGRHHEYFPQAQEMLEDALRLRPNHFEALATKAAMLLTLHHFEEAKQLAEQAQTRAPQTAFVYGVLCDALLELGDYEGAGKACDEMLSLKPDLHAYARAAYLRELHGDREGAVHVMRMACDAGVFGQENRAWALYQLGKLYFNLGRPDTAAYIYRGILEERPNYAYALAGLAQISSARGNAEEAIDLFKQAYRVLPDHGFLESLAGLYRSNGQTEKADEMIKLVLENFAQHEEQGWNIDLEYARFCGDHDLNLDEALRRSKRDHARRPNNIDALSVHGWLLHKNGKTAEALPLMEQAMRLRTPRSEIYARAGLMAQALGQNQKAINYLEQALALNAHFSTAEIRVAEQALAELRRGNKVS
ncbi:tetratricopeptide repeat protein [candidate division KSB1 bacterium]|nr:tetratricopeptide repeat protein [candidate division KSB1 bacterium]